MRRRLRRPRRDFPEHDVHHHGAADPGLLARTIRSCARRCRISSTSRCTTRRRTSSACSRASRRSGTRAITAFALIESGIPQTIPALQKAGEWILSKEVKDFRGDWKYKNPTPITSGWAFEFNNKFYPDVDDTFKVLLALGAIKMPDEAAKKKAMQRALEWAISFQCKNGGFAAFDKDVTKKWLQDVPFADHNAILDPPCSDITSRALEVFGRMGLEPQGTVRAARHPFRARHAAARRLVGRPLGRQLYLRHLAGAARPAAIGEDMNQDWILRGLNWLESCQNADGGWGETPRHLRQSRAQGPGREHAVADRLGAHGHHRRQRPRAPEHPRAASSISPARRMPTAPGPRTTSPAPASPRFSI